MPETTQLILIFFSVGVFALVLIAACSPWLCRPRIDTDALNHARAERFAGAHHRSVTR